MTSKQLWEIALCEMAERLYEATIKMKPNNPTQSINLWLGFFSHKELKTLWAVCQGDLSIAYDDEVYNALKTLSIN